MIKVECPMSDRQNLREITGTEWAIITGKCALRRKNDDD
jgi:hypothetical protein